MYNGQFSSFLRNTLTYQRFVLRIFGSLGLCWKPGTRLRLMPGQWIGFSVPSLGKSRGSLKCLCNVCF